MRSNSTLLVVVDDLADESRLVERLQCEPGVAVIGVATSRGDAISTAIKAAPDLVLLDLPRSRSRGLESSGGSLPDRPLDAVRRPQPLAPQGPSRARDLRMHGAFPNSEPVNGLPAGVRRVADGVNGFRRVEVGPGDGGSAGESTKTGHEQLSTLTPRELKVLKLIAIGLPQKLIAQRLTISIKTVDNHRSNLMNKLGIHDRVCLARFAIRERLVEA